MSNAVHAYGTTLGLQGGDIICELTNIEGPGETAEEIDVTSHCSTGARREYKPGLIEPGEYSIEGFVYPGDPGQQALHASFNARAVETYVATYPNAFEVVFDAYVSARPTFSAPVDGVLGLSAGLKVTGVSSYNYDLSANLTLLTASAGTFVPAFDGGVYEYVLNVTSGTSSITLTPTGLGVIKVNGNTVTTGTASSAIALGAAGTITEVLVTAQQTGKVPVAYSIKVTRAA